MTTTKDENNRVREWVIGLPSAADLTPLSHSLISRALSRAFCIPPSSTPAPCSEDVLRASQSTLQLLQQKSSPLALGSFDPYSSYESVGVYGAEGGGDEDRNVYESLKRNRGNLGRNGVRLNKSPIFNKGGWAYDKDQGRDGGETSPRIGGEGVGNGFSGTAIGQAYYWSGVSPGQSGSLGADVSRRCGLEEGVEFTNDANLEKFRKLADTESEDVDSADGLDGNPARTLKRPRLVWTPQLHKRFVDAVGHLGIKNAVPKTIMQLMNVEGLTRENVASHLQKYRLYLKRMQGLSSEGPSSSDPLFASAPLPPNLTSSPHFFGNHHLSRIESGVSCPPFGPSGVPSPHTPGMLVPGAVMNGSMHHFGRFDHHPYNIGLSRSASRPVLNFGDHRDRPLNSHSNQQGSGSPPRHVLSLFPPSGP